ncbi:GGDEF domain-containing protein [Gracilibacillus massiliensis]|uniref:GGDEF domain-containing protein n=1 Tax=Gracilibacillus massiliensis TaxID=1564956 RepID=UPI00071D943E|nr:diguanylate cyclase [Gracilibacillus massiliensis]
MMKKQSVLIMVILLVLLLTWGIALIFRPHTVPVHLFYFPIILAGWYWKMPGGLIVGMISGVLAGPLLFLEVTGNVNQMTMYWMIRLVFFSIIGGFVGNLFKKMRDDTKELTAHRKELEIQSKFANIDGLTLIPNRRKLDQVLEKEYEKFSEELTPLSVIMIDIDEFKVYNDTYGHLQGDECLKEVSGKIESLVRQEDFFARYGGEEFVIILPGTNRENALEEAKKIKNGIASLEIEHKCSSIEPYVTISMGLETIISTSDFGASELLKRADQALYNAKRNGRNQISAYSE